MATNRLASTLGILGLGGILALGSAVYSQQPPPDQPPPAPQDQTAAQQQGMDVLTSGPIHEAYAEPVDNTPKATPIVPKQPPDPIPEVPPDQKPAGENVEWIPGYWFWDDGRNDFVWVSGIWRVPPPDQQWMPGYWNQVQGGWQWVPGFWTSTQQQQGQEGQVELQYLPAPPEPLPAAPSTPAPDPNSVFVPGTWVYVTEQAKYAWRAGYWVDYQPGWVWVPARYCWTPVGYVFVDGHWDYELDRRGLLFAPVYFRERLWATPSWTFQPSYCVYPDYLLSCLFVRPQNYCYYFGDFFADRFVRQGFVAWIDYRVGRVGYDPLFSYYRWRHRDDRAWIQGLQTVYQERFRGTLARPPHTLREQLAQVNQVRTTNINIKGVNLVNAVVSIHQVNQSFVTLRPVTREERVAHQQFAREVVNETRQREQIARQLTAGGAPRRPTEKPQVAHLPGPKSPDAAREAERAHLNGRPVTVPGTLPAEERRAPETRPEPRPQSRPETRPQPQPEPRPQPRPETRPEPKPQPRPEPQPQPRPEPRPQSQPQPRPEPRPQPQPEPRPQPPPQTRPESRPQPQPPPRQAAPQPQPRPEPRPQPAPQRPQPPPRPDRPPPAPPHKPEPKK